MSAIQLSKEIESYQKDFQKSIRNMPSDTPAWLTDLRSRSIETYVGMGLPTVRQEDWKYTSTDPITRQEFRCLTEDASPNIGLDDIRAFTFGVEDWIRLVFVDGVFTPSLSSGIGQTAIPLSEAVRQDHPALQQHLAQSMPVEFNGFTALNTAFMREGAFVFVPSAEKLEKPIHLLYLAVKGQNSAIYPRNLVILGEGADASVIESYASLTNEAYLTNSVTEITLGSEAKLHFYKLQQEGGGGFHISAAQVEQGERSEFSCTTVNAGASLARNDLKVLIDGEHALCVLNGLSLSEREQHVDNHTVIDHAAPNCESHELYKAILDGRSRSVFNGKIFVRPGAQKTDAKQTNRSLLLSKDATVDTKPQLEIFADDVKCTHGATVGQLNEDEIFYLRSRGMSEDDANQLLRYGFANEVIEKIELDAVRSYLDDLQITSLHVSSELKGKV